MNRSKKFMYNTFASAIYQVIIMMIGIITPRIMLIAYGSETNGLVSSVTQFISYFTIVEAGLSGAAIYALYKPLSEKDHNKINSIVHATRNFYYQAGLIFLVLLVGLAIFYPFIVHSTMLDKVQISILVFVIGFNSIIDFFLLAKYRTLLSADQKSYILSIGSIISVLINFALVIVLATKGINIVKLKTIAVSAVVIRSIYLYLYCKKNYYYLNMNNSPEKSALTKRWDAFYLQLLQVVQKGAPVILITFLSGLKEVSLYTIYNMVIIGLSSLLDVFMSGLSAQFGDILASNNKSLLHKTYRDFEAFYYGLITILYSVAFLAIMPFIRKYTESVHDINYNEPLIGFLFVINAFLYNLKTPQGTMVIAAGHYKETKKQSTIQALIIVIGGIILVPFNGIVGILIAMIASNLYRDIDLLFYIPQKVTKLPVKESFFRIGRSMIIFIIIVFTMKKFINFNYSSFIEWSIDSLLLLIYSIVVWTVLLYIMDKRELMTIFGRIKIMLVKKY